MNKKVILAIILLLGLIRGSLYALSLPPWGLLDEEQHFDYILKIIQNGKPPIAGRDLLDPAVAQSVVDTNRHDKFHWPALPSPDPSQWGLEGYSYEGYQGPLFYYLSVPVYLMIPGGLVDKLFGLRLLMVLISLITVWIIMRIARKLFPGEPVLPYWLGLLAISIPERTSSTARLNNDVLLEVIAALFFWLITLAIIDGLSWKKGLLIGFIGGLGMLTKISFAGLLVLLPVPLIIHWYKKDAWVKAISALLLTLVMTIPFLVYSYLTYGDPTGFKGFADLYTRLGGILWDPHFTIANILGAIWTMFGSFWLVWWQGAEALYTPLLQGFWLLLLATSLLSLWGIRRQVKMIIHTNRTQLWTLLSYLGAMIVFLFVLGVGYFKGLYPIIQGRFILPILVPVVLFLCLGWSKLSKGRLIIILVSIGLIITDAFSLFGNLLPYYYIDAAFYINGQLISHTQPGLAQGLNIFMTNFISDKPYWVSVAFFLTVIAYLALIVSLAVYVIYKRGKLSLDAFDGIRPEGVG